MNPKQLTTKQMNLTAIVAGLTGGALLILKSILVKNGYLDIAIFAIVMVATFIFLLAKKYVNITFKKWFIVGTLTFTLMSYVLYVYVLFIVNPDNGIPLFGHLWRFAFIAGFGAAVSAILGLFLLKRKPATLQVS